MQRWKIAGWCNPPCYYKWGTYIRAIAASDAATARRDFSVLLWLCDFPSLKTSLVNYRPNERVLEAIADVHVIAVLFSNRVFGSKSLPCLTFLKATAFWICKNRWIHYITCYKHYYYTLKPRSSPYIHLEFTSLNNKQGISSLTFQNTISMSTNSHRKKSSCR